MIRVCIVQRRLTHYRVPLFVALRELLAERGIQLELLVGRGTPDEEKKHDIGELSWAQYIPTHYLAGGRLCWQPVWRYLAGADLVVVTQESKLIQNHLLLLAPRGWPARAACSAATRATGRARWRSPSGPTTRRASAAAAGGSKSTIPFACVVAEAGAVACFGGDGAENVSDGTGSGQLGTGVEPQGQYRYPPQPILGGLSFRDVVAGDRHACGLVTSGAAYCWGANQVSQLGTVAPKEECRTRTGSRFFITWSCSGVPVPVAGSRPAGGPGRGRPCPGGRIRPPTRRRCAR